MICIIEITFPWVNQINKCIYVFNIALISFNSVFTLCFLFPQFVGGELGGKNPFIKWGSSITLFLMWTIYIILASLKAYEILDWEVWKAEQWQVICYRECQNWAGGPWPWPALKVPWHCPFGFNYYTVVGFFSKHFGDERKETLWDKILYCYHNKDTGTFSVLLCRF